MSTTASLASIGDLIGHPTRAVMLEALYDGQRWTASALARAAQVTPSTASSHLRRLVEGGLLHVESSGRQRYFSLAGADVADALEALEVLATRRVVRPGINNSRHAALAEARTCYDHVAGRLGVTMVDALVRKGRLREGDDGFLLTENGREFFAGLDIDPEAIRGKRRAFARKCMDWTEHRYHLGGALGAALAGRLFKLGWLRRSPESRVVTVTALGRHRLTEYDLAPPRQPPAGH